MILNLIALTYRNFFKKLFFLFDAETVHEFIVNTGFILGKSDFIRNFLELIFYRKYSNLRQKIVGITFENPVGLAAGFDYEALLFHTLPSLNFGYETIGTITNGAYDGNPKPRLGRLPKSKSLMVNKGFKNKGALEISKRLLGINFKIPVGISIGITNNITFNSQKSAIGNIIQAFKIVETSNVKNAYYELNTSCPNLSGNISFYPPKNLDELLTGVDFLKIQKPIFIKMPIEKTNNEILKLLDIISKHKVKGVIFGNLQTNRSHSTIDEAEVKKFKHGNFSGLPTQKRSDELIALTYKHYKDRLIIIGTGGIFSAEDAYRKIKLGANLVQLITGLIFEGPQLVSQINRDLSKMVAKDGFKNISEAVGKS